MKRAICATFIALSFVLLAGTSAAGKAKTLTLPRSGTVAECRERGLDGKILLVMSRSCGHCRRARPRIEEVVQAKGLAERFEIIDTRDPGARERLAAYGLRVRSVPTLIVDCTIHVGARSKKEYEMIIVP